MSDPITLDLFAVAERKREAPPYQFGSETSRQAAVATRPAAETQRGRVLAFIEAHGPVNDEDIAVGLGMNPSTVRPRRLELQKAGLIRQDGETKNRSGHDMAAWVAGVASVAGT